MVNETIEYGQLLDLFPRCDGSNTFPCELQTPDFCYVTEANLRFVAPTFRLESTTAGRASPSVVLISAPAAMGKSVVARRPGTRFGSASMEFVQIYSRGGYVYGHSSETFRWYSFQ